MNIYEYIFLVAGHFYLMLVGIFRQHIDWLGKTFEGIAIGMYANVIGGFVRGESKIGLIYQTIVAIILTIASIKFSKEKQ